MRTSNVVAGLLASAVFMTAAVAQNAPQQAPASAPAASRASTPMSHPGYWRASKLIGVDVYNNQNEKIGDINEVLVDPSGKLAGVVIGVGGFLGMGEHDVMVKLDEIKFVNEPVRSASSEQRSAANAPANTTGSAARTARPARAADEKWYPDHAVMNATKEKIKAMPEFKYSNYN